jgi:hypothetical protein
VARDSPCLRPVTSDRDRPLLPLAPDGILDAVAYRHKMSAFVRLCNPRCHQCSRMPLGRCQFIHVLPGAEDSDVGGVHDADEEPGNSGGLMVVVPGLVGEVPG